MAIQKWTKSNQGCINADVDLDKVVPLSRLKIKDFDEPVIMLVWVNSSTLECVTEKSRDLMRIKCDQIESIITQDILA